jgi:cytidylate kinase
MESRQWYQELVHVWFASGLDRRITKVKSVEKKALLDVLHTTVHREPENEERRIWRVSEQRLHGRHH